MHDTDTSTRIPFGPKPHQTIPREYAARILTSLAAGSPAVFGRLLREVVLSDLAATNGQPEPGQGE